VELEKVALSKAIMSFDQYFAEDDREKHKINIESKDLIKKLVKYLQYGFSNKAKKETMISTLQTLIKMIDRENPKEREELQVKTSDHELIMI